MRQTSVAIESAKGVNMHAIRPACTIFAIWSSVQLRWTRGAGIWNWEDKFLCLREVGEWGTLVGNESSGYKRSQEERRQGLMALICVRERGRQHYM